MKARAIVLSMIFVILSAVSANAQQYYRPFYSQKPLASLPTAPVFVENRTGGDLEVTFDVGGMLVPVKVAQSNEVPDLMLPVYSTVKVKEARTAVLDKGKRVWKKVKFYAYWRQDVRGGSARQGWLFYLDGLLKP